MSEYGHDNGFDFPHDGEHGKNCTGYGCTCDEENYPRSHSHRSSSSGTGIGYWIVFILALILGYGINELLGVIIIIGLVFWVCVTR